jgi:hypothetical protein
MVSFKETRPFSRHKRHILKDILRRQPQLSDFPRGDSAATTTTTAAAAAAPSPTA